VAKRAVLRLLTSLIAFALFAELLGLIAYYVDTGALFYLHGKEYPEPFATPEDRLSLGEAVHPYFGFTHTPGTPFDIPASLQAGTATESAAPPRDTFAPRSTEPALRTNNFGFVAPHDYPFPKAREQQFVIGIFGGSVGVWFCQLGAPRMADALKQHPYFQNREVIPLCFSHEGYKQPQEALALTYFLSVGQTFDLVVNLDGFNDVALGALNDSRGLDVSMPSAQHLGALIDLINQSAMTPDKLQSLAAIFRGRARLAELTASIRRNRLASVHVVLDRSYWRVRDDYVRELGRYNTLPSNPPDNALVRVSPAPRTRDAATLFSDIAATWARSSILMHDTLAARGTAYVHVLQPNQYYSMRAFSEAEAATALSDASPYKTAVEHGYPRLVAAGASLLNRRIRFVDATGVFNRTPAPVYMDNCCHYTLAGNQVLADFMAAAILRTPGPWVK